MHSIFGLFGNVIWTIIVTHFIVIRELFQIFIYKKQKCVKEKIVVVTGSGHGLGRRIAKDFARLGATVVCWDVDKERNENTVWDIKNTNGKGISVICDVTDRNHVFRTVEYIRENVGEIDIFVSSVGIYPVQEILLWKPQELYELFDTNVMAQFWILQSVVPNMIKRKSGHFVAISSAAAIAPVGNEVPYSMTKSALSCLMDGFIQEIRNQNYQGIKLTCVHPYYTNCRDDIPVKFDLRFGRLSPDYVSKEIVKGIRQECEIISVPRFMLFWIHFMKLLPFNARMRWRDVFYTRVYPTDNTSNKYTQDGKVKNIVEQFKLPPLNQDSSKIKSNDLQSIKIVSKNGNDIITNNNNNNNSLNDKLKPLPVPTPQPPPPPPPPLPTVNDSLRL
ncbi:17-beta hydroxysteroid dehydrogenase, putative [Pediculus humanus corporis]|uniref:17-beta hydroxysteroid dehydrogenase, putative n=1 Tax=Pediculus humanus subsp. corporis TaxID=121224 RepID=E0W4E1_PEDHC|nr:17-beta hydroxysteroid dehydrogenase, putative [Pediculus humanus corporis]EEB20497.1 17-beta hydroxysteroid dehydrogenase, putative [Pediculus humanus corporis]